MSTKWTDELGTENFKLVKTTPFPTLIPKNI